MANPFREAIRGSRTAFTQALDVSNLLLGELQDNEVITTEQYEKIWVRDVIQYMKIVALT